MDERRAAEACLLGVVPTQPEALRFILDNVGCNWWVVRYLLDEEFGNSSPIHVRPGAIEHPRVR